MTNDVINMTRYHGTHYHGSLDMVSIFLIIQNSWPFKMSTCRLLWLQWIRICLPMWGPQVRSLVQEDSTCHGATKLMSHNYWAHVPRACAQQQGQPPLLTTSRSLGTAAKRSPHSLQLEKAEEQSNEDSAQPKQKKEDVYLLLSYQWMNL